MLIRKVLFIRESPSMGTGMSILQLVIGDRIGGTESMLEILSWGSGKVGEVNWEAGLELDAPFDPTSQYLPVLGLSWSPNFSTKVDDFLYLTWGTSTPQMQRS